LSGGFGGEPTPQMPCSAFAKLTRARNGHPPPCSAVLSNSAVARCHADNDPARRDKPGDDHIGLDSALALKLCYVKAGRAVERAARAGD